MTNEEIKEIQREIRETQARLTVLQKVAGNLKPEPEGLPLIPEPWARWRATEQEAFYQVGKGGDIEKNVECLIDWDDNAYAFGNYFRTQELAERHAKRLQSIVPTCAMPEKGQVYWNAFNTISGVKTARLTWAGGCADYSHYFSGTVFLTKEAAEAWIAEFGDVWTTGVDGEGE